MLISSNKAYLRLFTVVFMFIFFISNCSTNNSSITKPPPTTEKNKITNLSNEIVKSNTLNKDFSTDIKAFIIDKNGKQKSIDVKTSISDKIQKINKEKLSFSIKSVTSFVPVNTTIGSAVGNMNIVYDVTTDKAGQFDDNEEWYLNVTGPNIGLCKYFNLDLTGHGSGRFTITIPDNYWPSGTYTATYPTGGTGTVTVSNNKTLAITSDKTIVYPANAESVNFNVQIDSPEFWDFKISGAGLTGTLLSCQQRASTITWTPSSSLPAGDYEIKVILKAFPSIFSTTNIKIAYNPTSPTPSPTSTPTSTPTPEPTPSPSDNTCGCNNNLSNGFSIKGCNSTPCPTPTPTPVPRDPIYTSPSPPCYSNNNPNGAFSLGTVYNSDVKGTDLTFVTSINVNSNNIKPEQIRQAGLGQKNNIVTDSKNTNISNNTSTNVLDLALDAYTGVTYSPQMPRVQIVNAFNQKNPPQSHLAKIWGDFPYSIPYAPQFKTYPLYMNSVNSSTIYPNLIGSNGKVIPNKYEKVTLNIGGEKIVVKLSLDPNKKEGPFYKWKIECSQ